MNDYIVRATAADSQIRAFAATTKGLVEKARAAHDTCPTVTAALGRLLTAGSMMGTMMKGDDDLLTLQIRGDGPVKGLTVTADATGNVKGYPNVSQVNLPASANGKLDVGTAVGNGILSVIKDMGLKDPYVGQTAIQTGEIAEDLTYYFAYSEQTPSSVGLGVLMSKENTVRQAGGFIIQVMPFVEDSTLEKLEENLKKIESVTTMLEKGMTPEDILRAVLDGFDVTFTDKKDVDFTCNCSRERVEKVLITLGKQELESMIKDGEPVTLHCQFCHTAYTYSIDELQEILDKATK